MKLSELMQKGSLRQFATLTVATVATVSPKTPPSVASVTTVSVATAQKQAANDSEPMAPQPLADPDRWCWPHSTAMNTGEIDTYTARLARFNDKGLSLDDREALADKLVLRDRESNDRRLCLECAHLAGRAGAMRCAQWQRAGLGAAYVPAGLHMVLQRCDGFKDQNPQRITTP